MAIKPSAEMIQAIRKYKNGDQQAFEMLYSISVPYLTKCVYNVINRTAPGAPEELAQDILQDTYLSIAEKLDTLENEEAFFQWAGQIATNHALRTWDKSARQRDLEQPQDELLYELPDERFIPEDILENKEKQRLIRQMLQELPTGQYLCLVEYFYNGLKEAEVAEKLGMPLGTVKTNLFRAKKKLKQIVQTHEKKHGVKLYSMSWLLLVLFWDEIKGAFAGTGVVLAEAAGTSATVGGAAASASASAAASASAGAATATGLTAKIIAGIVAAVIAVGGAGMMIRNAADQEPDKKPDTTQTTETTSRDEADQPEDTPVQPEQTETGDVILTAEDLAYINRLVNRFRLGAVGYGPEASFQQGNKMLHVNALVVGCAGTEGLLKGTATGNGLQVRGAELEKFLMDTLGFAASVSEYGDPVVKKLDGDTYLIPAYTGDQSAPISIHDLRALDQNTVRVITPRGYTSYACVFKRSAESPYGWILTAVTDTRKAVSEKDVMTNGLFSVGVVLPADGAGVLTGISVGGELTMEAAKAYMRQYLLKTTGAIPAQVTAEDWGLVANSYYTYKILCKDSRGNTQHCFLIGASDSAIFDYDETTHQMKEISWKLSR